jgi:SSS family solute:Na+ symporter
MNVIDWVIVGAYFVVVVIIGARFTKRASKSMEEYFVAGRKAPWWLAGAGMIATTFAADTPLVVTGLVAAHGVAGNWLWWCFVASGIFTVFVTARLWHRAGVLSDVELVELRYGGAAAKFLRGFRAVFLALPVNLIILGWVNLAMIKVLKVTLGVDGTVAVIACFAVTVLYSAAGGMWAALWTDLVQLCIMMTAVIALAFFTVDAVGGLDKMLAGVDAHFGSRDAAVSVLPPWDSPWMPALALVTMLAVQWWAAWYPGSEPGGGGYVAQRIFATRSERDGVLSVLLFNVGHYALRPWPWIITGLCTVILYPGGIILDGKPDVEAAYVQAMVDHLPTGLKGFLLAGFFAAYMSTVSTHLNWGASYLVNDVYKRFIAPDAPQKKLVNVSRVVTACIFVLSIFVTSQMQTIEGAWRALIALGAGTGAVLILRWLWWRINAWSEVSAMLASVVFSQVASFVFTDKGPENDAKQLLFIVACSAVVWIVVTLATKPEPDDVLRKFIERVKPFGPGWAATYARLGMTAPEAPLATIALGFVLGVTLVYTAVFAIGQLILGPRAVGAGLLAVAVVCAVVLSRIVKRLTT